MPIYKRGPVQIHYEEAGSGFPLLGACEVVGFVPGAVGLGLMERE
jgi:hypothetical protein